jgi:hypothetical protein
MTIEQLFRYLEMVIAEASTAGDRTRLSRAQTTCGVLMDAAMNANDRETAARFRALAAKAANYIEEIER